MVLMIQQPPAMTWEQYIRRRPTVQLEQWASAARALVAQGFGGRLWWNLAATVREVRGRQLAERRRKYVASRVVPQLSEGQTFEPAPDYVPHGDAPAQPPPPQDYPVMPHHQRGREPAEDEGTPQTEDECMDAILAAAETDTATGA